MALKVGWGVKVRRTRSWIHTTLDSHLTPLLPNTNPSLMLYLVGRLHFSCGQSHVVVVFMSHDRLSRSDLILRRSHDNAIPIRQQAALWIQSVGSASGVHVRSVFIDWKSKVTHSLSPGPFLESTKTKFMLMQKQAAASMILLRQLMPPWGDEGYFRTRKADWQNSPWTHKVIEYNFTSTFLSPTEWHNIRNAQHNHRKIVFGEI